MGGNHELRLALQEITDWAADKGLTCDQLEGLFEQTAKAHPHSIHRIDDESFGYRCFGHAFNLATSGEYQLIADLDATTGKSIFFAGSSFARYLIDSGALMEIGEDEIAAGDLIIYFCEDDIPKHAAKVAAVSDDSLRLKSKWGGGLFLEHKVWEVPESYGNTVKFYRPIPAEDSEIAFLEYVTGHPEFGHFVEAFDLQERAEGWKIRRWERDYLKKLIENTSETMPLWSNKSKPERQSMITRAFLRCVGMDFEESELVPEPNEPIDVEFRDAKFQIIEILDDGRRRGE